jgi:SAM-dependent methyltransferase
MKPEDITRIYDDAYAAAYEEKFLLSPEAKPDSDHELALLRGFLTPGVTWLDVACGTGYFLRHFPDIERTGIDLSPAMLRRAREANPGIPLIQGDFRDRHASALDRWGLVSCMWYAYGLVDTVADVLRLIENMAAWTARAGTCFMPLLDPDLITGVKLPYEVGSPVPGRVMITGILWSFIEDGGRKVHSQMVAPNLEFMVEQFRRYFEDVSIVRYPPPCPDVQGRPALVARRKRVQPRP